MLEVERVNADEEPAKRAVASVSCVNSFILLWRCCN